MVSCNGVLKVSLQVEVTDYVFYWLKLGRRSYNSEIPGPTWRIKRGDNVVVHVVRITRPYGLMITLKVYCKNMNHKLFYQNKHIGELTFANWLEK